MKLLDLQEIDSTVVQLRHRRASLPQLKELDTLNGERSGILDRVRDARITVDDLAVEQAKAEADVEQVRVRHTRDRERMDSGQISNPKDLQRMTHELESLERRVATLEDAELEVMEKMEDAQAVLTRAEEELAAVDQRVADLEAERDVQWAQIDAELESVQASRAPVADGIDTDLVQLYERLRESRNILYNLIGNKVWLYG